MSKHGWKSVEAKVEAIKTIYGANKKQAIEQKIWTA
jgi:hypothetical protein